MKVEMIFGKDLSEKRFAFIRKSRKEQYGNADQRFQKRDHKGTIFFFVKENQKVVAMGALRKIGMVLEGKEYDIFGIAGILSLKKGTGYGKVLIESMVSYLKKTNKTGLGFCGRKNKIFYGKAGLKYKNLLGKRFALRNPKNGETKFEEPEDIGDGIYYEGKDEFISKLLKTKSVGYYWLPRIGDPHW
jgi:hypothetical protein